MQLELQRRYKGGLYTIGALYVDGVWFCDTLEDTDRGLLDTMPEKIIQRKKVFGKTAIPTGTYHIDMDTVSAKFLSRVWAKPYGGKLPRLLSVPGYNGVLIHVGNRPEDTDGCVLVGRNTVKGQLTSSTETFRKLMDLHLIPAHNRKEAIIITIR